VNKTSRVTRRFLSEKDRTREREAVKAIRSSKHPVIARSRARTLAGAGAAAVGLAAGLVASAPGASAATDYPRPAIAVAGGEI